MSKPRKTGAPANKIDVTPEIRAAALEALAQRLYETLEICDPESNDNGNYFKWADLTEHQKEIYRHCINRICQETELISAMVNARSVPAAT